MEIQSTSQDSIDVDLILERSVLAHLYYNQLQLCSCGISQLGGANYLDRLIVWRFGSCPELYTQPVTDVHKGKQVIAAYHPNDVTVFDHR